MKPWFVYIVECLDGSYYTGISVDIKKRIDQHNLKKGSKYVRSHGVPVKLLWWCQSENRSQASKIEYRIKKLSKKDKIKLVNGDNGWMKNQQMN